MPDREAQSVYQSVFPLIAPILSVQSGHFLSQLGAVRGENRGPVSRVADRTLIDGRHRDGGQRRRPARFHFHWPVCLDTAAEQNLHESPCTLGSVVQKNRTGIQSAPVEPVTVWRSLKVTALTDTDTRNCRPPCITNQDSEKHMVLCSQALPNNVLCWDFFQSGYFQGFCPERASNKYNTCKKCDTVPKELLCTERKRRS